VRCFVDDDVTHVAGKVDPLSDIETIDTELVLADLDTAERALDRSSRQTKSGDKEAKKLTAILETVVAHLGAGHPLRTLELEDERRQALKTWQFITAKPVLYVANVDDSAADDNAMVAKVRERAARLKTPKSWCCAPPWRLSWPSFRPEDQAEFLAELGQTEPGLHRLIRAGYQLLDLSDLLHRRGKGSARLDRAQGIDRPAGGRSHPHRFRKGLHPGRSHRLSTTTSPARAKPAPRPLASCAWKGAITWSGKAM
jgi:ribosome-binding ATPase